MWCYIISVSLLATESIEDDYVMSNQDVKKVNPTRRTPPQPRSCSDSRETTTAFTFHRCGAKKVQSRRTFKKLLRRESVASSDWLQLNAVSLESNCGNASTHSWNDEEMEQ